MIDPTHNDAERFTLVPTTKRTYGIQRPSSRMYNCDICHGITCAPKP